MPAPVPPPAPVKCPKCGGELVDGTCLFDGPLSEILATMRQAKAGVAHPDTGEVVARPVHKGWTGYDRELGAKKKAERAREAVAVEERAKWPGRLAAAFGTLLSFAAIAAVVVLWKGGALEAEVAVSALPRSPPAAAADGTSTALSRAAALPSRLSQPASAARGDLALFARALDELAIECDAKLVGDADPDAGVVARYRSRLDALHDAARPLEPALTREETRILMALQQAERDMAAWLRSFEGPSPEVGGERLQNARDNVERALLLLRGGQVESAVQTYARKASAAQQLEAVEKQ